MKRATERRQRMADTVIINGIVYEVLETREDGTLVVCRPNGIKTYLARRLPDHPVYGANRGAFVKDR